MDRATNQLRAVADQFSMQSDGVGSGGGDGGVEAAAQPSALLAEKIKREVGVAGIANIPNQVHYLASHAQTEFNILLMGMRNELAAAISFNPFVGDVSLGKTGVINRVLGGIVFENKLELDQQTGDSSPMLIRVRQQEVVDSNVRATIRLVDAPQVGHSIRKEEGYVGPGESNA